jgi:hypothetical protein
LAVRATAREMTRRWPQRAATEGRRRGVP